MKPFDFENPDVALHAPAEGAVAIPRELMALPVMQRKPYPPQVAILDLFFLANRSGGTHKFDGQHGETVAFEAGWCLWSYMALSDRWGWSQGSVAALVRELVKAEVVRVQPVSKRRQAILVLPLLKETLEERSGERLKETLAEMSEKSSAERYGETEGEGEGEGEEEPRAGAMPIAPVPPSREVGVGVPEDVEVLAFAEAFAGELATGAPGPIPPDFAAAQLAEWHGRREFPVRWHRAMVAVWRSSFRAWSSGTHRWQFALHGPRKKNGAEKAFAGESGGGPVTAKELVV
jgi:hypothetical protein